jgi:hypothetical protein
MRDTEIMVTLSLFFIVEAVVVEDELERLVFVGQWRPTGALVASRDVKLSNFNVVLNSP